MGKDSYGEYILSTGQELGQHELLRGKYFYETRFKGKAPILDLGPGRCWFMKQNPVDIIGVDNSPEIINRYTDEGLNLQFGDAYDIPFPDNHFGGAFCSWLYEHLENPDRALSELYRVMKPGGYTCIVVPTPHDIEAFYDDYTHVRPYTKRSLAQLAKAVGFKKYRTTYLYYGKFSNHILRYFGSAALYRYILFSDSVLRKLGIVNKRNLILETWKPQENS